MRKIVILGTLHLGHTPKDKLQAELEELKPDQLFVELPPENSNDREAAEKHSDEMLFAYNWAKENKVPVVSYDTEENVLKDGAEDNEEYKRLSKEESAHSETLSWEEIKSGNINNSVWDQLLEQFFDKEIWDAREENLVQNIKKEMIGDGTIVVLTGAAHVGFIKRKIT